MKAKILMAALTTMLCVSVTDGKRPVSHTNPVMRQNVPDPSVIKANDGFWYMMSTTTGEKGTVPLYRSTNLVDWTKVGDMTLSTVKEQGYDIWSPKLFEKNGKYLMFYSVNAANDPGKDNLGQEAAGVPRRAGETETETGITDPDTSGPEDTTDGQYKPRFDERGKYIGYAIADHPAGPWEDKGKLFDGYDYENVEPVKDEEGNEVYDENGSLMTVIEPGSRTVDPFYFEDDKGQEYLFWGNNHNLYGMEISISDDFAVSYDLAKKKKLGGIYMASVTLYKHIDTAGKTWYYMLASQGEQGWNSSAVVVGRSETPLGTYRGSRGNSFLAGGTVTVASKVISFDKENPDKYEYIGCGHPSRIITDEKGDTWFFCHGSDKTDFDMNVRMPFLCKVLWIADPDTGDMWPELSNHYPLTERNTVPAVPDIDYPHGISDVTVATPLANDKIQEGSIFDVFLLGETGMGKLNERKNALKLKLNDYRTKGADASQDRADISQWVGGNLNWASDEVSNTVIPTGDGANFNGFTLRDNNDRIGNGDKDNAGWSAFYVDVKDGKDISHVGKDSRVHIVLKLQNDIVPPYVNIRWFSQGSEDRTCPQFSLSDYKVRDYKIQEWAPIVGSLVKGVSSDVPAQAPRENDSDTSASGNDGWVAIDMSLPEIADKMKTDYGLDMDYSRFENATAWKGHALEITLPSGYSIDDKPVSSRGYGANIYVDGAYVYTPHVVVSSVENVSAASDGVELVVAPDHITVLGEGNTPVALYSVNGQLVRSSRSPVVGIDGVQPGVYLVKTASTVKKVIIK